MKTQIVKFLSILLVGVLAAGALAAFPSRAVYAQSTTSQRSYAALQNAYQREQTALATQANHLTMANNTIGRVQDIITRGNTNGLDTSSLQSALSSFQASLATAQTDHNNAAGVLSSHNGFDGSGNVTDATAALQTVTTAAQDLSAAATTLANASTALVAAAKSYVTANESYYEGKMTDAYNRLNDWLNVQTTNLGRLNDAATKLQDYITKAKANGEDTSSLEAVLADLNAQIPQSQSYHDQATSTLSTHAGFDSNGNVTDATTAHQTLETARQQLNNSKNINVALGLELQNAIQSWKSSHPAAAPLPTIAAPATEPGNG
ncbi:MAG TPA: hypothetical protein VMC62_10230 [Longilinea sp.]|nr:hypothetical protein [Longilinea sp.]